MLKAVGEDKLKNLRLYSDPECTALKEELAKVYAVNKSQVYVGNGSDEVLNFIFMAYGQGGVAFADLTYGFYSVFASLYGQKTQIIPLKEDFSLDVNAFREL